MSGTPIILRYSAAEPEKIFREFRGKFNAMVKEDALVFSGELGTGSMQRMELEEGLLITILDLSLSSAVTFIRTASSEGKFYPIFFHCSHSPIRQKVGDEERILQPASRNAIFLASPEIETTFTVNANERLNALVLGFTRDWLEKYFSDNSVHPLKMAIQSNDPFFIHESIDYKTQGVISSILENAAHEAPFLLVKAKAYELLMLFLNKIGRRKGSVHAKDIRSNDIDLLFKAKSMIEKEPTSFLPVASLAKIIGISESKLQKKFKLVFGQSLYQYHLLLKMELAKQLIEQGKMSITQIGFKLGYSNLGHFSGAFKKQFGCSPSEYASLM